MPILPKTVQAAAAKTGILHAEPPEADVGQTAIFELGGQPFKRGLG
jgi:hypothetical protein